MSKYLISFPSVAMTVTGAELASVGEAARRVVSEAKQAGVYVFGGGIDEGVPPVLVNADGRVTRETYARTASLNGGFCVLELPSREAAIEWAAKLAGACRCAQELRAFHFDPES